MQQQQQQQQPFQVYQWLRRLTRQKVNVEKSGSSWATTTMTMSSSSWPSYSPVALLLLSEDDDNDNDNNSGHRESRDERFLFWKIFCCCCCCWLSHFFWSISSNKRIQIHRLLLASFNSPVQHLNIKLTFFFLYILIRRFFVIAVVCCLLWLLLLWSCMHCRFHTNARTHGREQESVAFLMWRVDASVDSFIVHMRAHLTFELRSNYEVDLY